MGFKAIVLAVVCFAFFYALPYYFNLNSPFWTLQIDLWIFSLVFNWLHVIGFFFASAIYISVSWLDKSKYKQKEGKWE